jgi:RNA-binding protein
MSLNSKQRAYLRSLAAGEQAIMQVGKDGIGENLVKTVSDALEARELIKLTVLAASPEGASQTGEKLASAVGAELVCTVGRKIVLYRESQTNKRIDL